MIYEFAITVPKSRAESNPVVEELKITHGVIHRVDVQFPVGCAGLAHCKIYHQESQKWPSNTQGSFASDGYPIIFDENYEVKDEPYFLKAKCWNDDDTYQHIITIRLGVLDNKMALMVLKVIKGLTKMLKLMGIKV